jgi:hypothetical protein
MMSDRAQRRHYSGAGPIGEPPQGRRGIQDRAAYMSFLETQLERVTATCDTVSSYSSRLDHIHDVLADHASKIAGSTKLAKIAQTFAEHIEDDMKKFKQLYAAKFQRLDERYGIPWASIPPPTCPPARCAVRMRDFLTRLGVQCGNIFGRTPKDAAAAGKAGESVQRL